MARTLKEQIKTITNKARGPRSIEQFARELGAGNADKYLVGRFLAGADVPTVAMLRGVLRSPDTTLIGRSWARACLKLIDMAATEPTTELDVERRL